MIVVIADDLSGAAELAGAARLRGLVTEVHTRFCAETSADVVCVDTGTRALPPSEAAVVTENVIRDVLATGAEWIYLKFDSVLRGNILVQLRAAMAVTGRTTALLATANPSRGRVIRGGNYLIDGVPLHETAFSRDPEHPSTSASVTELLGAETTGVTTPDVEDTADLARLAAGAGHETLLAGSVEFFEALLADRGPVGRPVASTDSVARMSRFPGGEGSAVTLLSCGSLTSWATRRREAQERGVQIFEISGDATGVVGALERDGVALLGIGDAEQTHGATPSALVGRLAERTVAVARDIPLDRLLLEGGATAAAVVRQFGWHRLITVPAGAPGVGALRPVGRETPTLFIKPGSYSWPAGLW